MVFICNIVQNSTLLTGMTRMDNYVLMYWICRYMYVLDMYCFRYMYVLDMYMYVLEMCCFSPFLRHLMWSIRDPKYLKAMGVWGVVVGGCVWWWVGVGGGGVCGCVVARRGRGRRGKEGTFLLHATLHRHGGTMEVLRLYVVANVSCVSCTETLLIGNYSFTLFKYSLCR